MTGIVGRVGNQVQLGLSRGQFVSARARGAGEPASLALERDDEVSMLASPWSCVDGVPQPFGTVSPNGCTYKVSWLAAKRGADWLAGGYISRRGNGEELHMHLANGYRHPTFSICQD